MIFHIPHASTAIPPAIRAGIVLSDEQLAEEILKITDWFTDDLFGSHARAGDTALVYSVSRLIVDPERFIDDAQEPMAKVGMGVVFTCVFRRNPATDSDRKRPLIPIHSGHPFRSKAATPEDRFSRS